MKVGKPLLSPEQNFVAYLKSQRTVLAIWMSVAVLQCALLEFLFPYPDFFSDSYTYVADAVVNLGLSFRPQGYPDFLVYLHQVMPSPGLVVLTQYLLFILSSLFCILSCGYLFGLNRRKTNWLLAAVLLNPMLVFTTNLVSSDSLFCSLTVLWFTSLLWVIRKVGWANLTLHVLLLLACLHVRYTALFYFIISSVAFLVAQGKGVLKAIGIAATLSVLCGYISWQQDKAERLVNVRVFSGFSNWQIANNVLCYYKNIEVQATDMPSKDDSIIDYVVKRFIDTIYTEGRLGTQYMWDKRSPLKRYVMMRARLDKEKYFREWMLCSEEIGEYGRTLVKKYPMAYVRYFMLPNFRNFLVPDLEALEDYNVYNLTVTKECKRWYNLDTDFLYPRYLHLERRLMAAFPYLNCGLNLFNILFIFSFLILNWKRRKTLDRNIRGLFVAWAVFYFTYLLFSVASAYIVFRYLDITFVLGVIMPVVLFPTLRSRWQIAAGKPSK